MYFPWFGCEEGLQVADAIVQRRKLMADARYTYDGQGTSIFWALLVEPVCDMQGVNTGSYRRVGMGLVGNEGWLGVPDRQDIAIV
jgi:hypothetical protein